MSAQNVRAIQYDMDVYTLDAVPLGRVKQIHENDILVDCERAREALVPLMFIGEVLLEERRIEIEMTEDEFNDRAWEHPPRL